MRAGPPGLRGRSAGPSVEEGAFSDGLSTCRWPVYASPVASSESLWQGCCVPRALAGGSLLWGARR